jgi:hypothetical protein
MRRRDEDLSTSDSPDAAPPDGTAGAAAGAGAEAGAWIETLPFRVLGALLLAGSLDPPHWPHTPCPQWFFGALAASLGFWAAAPIVDRPVLDSHTRYRRALRHRNTLLAGAAAFLAAFQSPPVWLMAVEVLLLLAYLTAVDAAAAPARPPRVQLVQALWAGAGSAVVLLSAVAPITGGSWGRLVSGLCVLGTLGLLWAALRRRRPAGYAPQT